MERSEYVANENHDERNAIGAQLALRKTVRSGLWSRLREWWRMRRLPLVVRTGMGELARDRYREMVKFARETGDRGMLEMLKPR